MYAFESLGNDWEIRLKDCELSLKNDTHTFAVPFSGEWEGDLRNLVLTFANALFHDAYQPTMIEVTELAPLQAEIDKET